MKKELRLKSNQVIEKVVRKKNTVGNKFFVIYKGEDTTKPQFAISVGKKYGIAVLRNQIKRRVRSILQTLELGNYQVLIVVKPTVAELEFSEIEKQLKYLLKKHSVVKEMKKSE